MLRGMERWHKKYFISRKVIIIDDGKIRLLSYFLGRITDDRFSGMTIKNPLLLVFERLFLTIFFV